jgi:hypothetical protein
VLPKLLGNQLKIMEITLHVFWALYQQYEGEGGVISTDILSFPVKHNWFEKADMDLIRRSCRELMEVADELGLLEESALLPRPGCGNGKLDWSDVKREIEPILDDRISVVTFSKS